MSCRPGSPRLALAARLRRGLMAGVAVLALGCGAVAAAGYDEGLRAFEEGRLTEAAAIWQGLAEQGDRLAQYAVGKLHESGEGLAQDYAAAAVWYGRAAQQGLAAAQNNLALLYSTGRGVARDPVMAARLWQHAAVQGHMHAQYNLGLAYYLGEGVARDDRQAARWFLAAARAGLAEAQFAIAQMNRTGTGVPKDEGLALGWYRAAAARGHAEAARRAEELTAQGVVARAQPLDDLAPQAAVPFALAEGAAPPPLDLPLGAVAAAELPQPLVTQPLVTQGATLPPVEPSPPAEPQVIDGVIPPPEKPSRPVALAAAAPAESPPAAEIVAATPPAATPPAGAAPSGVTPRQADPGGDSRLWLGTGESQAEAQAIAQAATARFPAVFAALPLEIATLESGGTQRWRVQAGPLAEAAARDLCAELRAAEAGLFCKAIPR